MRQALKVVPNPFQNRPKSVPKWAWDWAWDFPGKRWDQLRRRILLIERVKTRAVGLSSSLVYDFKKLIVGSVMNLVNIAFWGQG